MKSDTNKNKRRNTLDEKNVVAIRAQARDDDTCPTVVSIAEYRKMLKDNKSTDEQILDRLRYLEALCRNVIRDELENYVNTKS